MERSYESSDFEVEQQEEKPKKISKKAAKKEESSSESELEELEEKPKKKTVKKATTSKASTSKASTSKASASKASKASTSKGKKKKASKSGLVFRIKQTNSKFIFFDLEKDEDEEEEDDEEEDEDEDVDEKPKKSKKSAVPPSLEPKFQKPPKISKPNFKKFAPRPDPSSDVPTATNKHKFVYNKKTYYLPRIPHEHFQGKLRCAHFFVLFDSYDLFLILSLSSFPPHAPVQNNGTASVR